MEQQQSSRSSAGTPLADRIRPQSLDDMVGQPHLFGAGKPLRKLCERGFIPNMIFYGPSGTGKTTAAFIISRCAGRAFHRLNATTASTADVKEILAQSGTMFGTGGILLYLDEIQYFNKKQQQALLEYIEDGRVVLIASTTENPYFYVYGALLSRSMVFEFKPIPPDEIARALRRAYASLRADDGADTAISEEEEQALRDLAGMSSGDARRAMNLLECAYTAAWDGEEGRAVITREAVEGLASGAALRYDRTGDEHYDVLSAFHKSLRGSDPDAALHYLARMLLAGDLQAPARRLLCVASEDVGAAYPMAAAVVKACVDSALQLGLPEAALPLCNATVFLATCPKSNSAAAGYWAACADMQNYKDGDGGVKLAVPRHLKNTHADGADAVSDADFSGALDLGDIKAKTAKVADQNSYKYPHNYPGNYVKQQYLPDALAGHVYYQFGDNRTEQAARAFMEKMKQITDNK